MTVFRAALLLLAFLALAGEAQARIHVIDGDTIVVDGEHIRLVGLDAPETVKAQCEAERALGYRAKERLAEILAASCGTLASAPATCLRIARQSAPDRYGRTLATLRAGTADPAAILIREGLARPYSCAPHCPPRGGWCREGL